MKRFLIQFFIFSFFLFLLDACHDDLPIVPDKTASFSAVTKSAGVLDDNLLLIQAAMQRVDSAVPFLDEFYRLYGTPLWEYAIPLGEEERDISYFVPVYDEKHPNIINTIWFFDIFEDTLRYRTFTRENEHIRANQQDFVFDELSYNIFGDESAGVMKFEDPPQTRAWGKEYYDCHYGIIEWGDIEVFNELLCKERTVWISETIDSTDANPIIGGETGIGGGGGGDGDGETGNVPSGSSNSKITKENLNQRISDIKKRMKELACNIDDVEIGLPTGVCASNARVEVDEITGKKKIALCYKFFGFEYQDQISIIYHEAYHCNYGEALSSKYEMPLNPSYYLQIPQEHLDYLLKYEFDGITNAMSFINKEMAKITVLRCPEYYMNEINAYNAEIRLNPSVSEKYSLERLFVLWVQQTLYNYSLKHYKF